MMLSLFGSFLTFTTLVCIAIPALTSAQRHGFSSRLRRQQTNLLPRDEIHISTKPSKQQWRNLIGEEDFTFADCTTVKCDEILQELTKDEVQTLLDRILSEAVGGELFYLLSGLKAAIDNLIKYGVRVQKICAKCSDFESPTSKPTCYDEICGSSLYGSNVTVSGLLFLPIQHNTNEDNGEQSSMILPGLLKGSFWSRGTQAHTCSQIPSENWANFLNMVIPSILPSFLLASNGFVSISPDNFGYGESFDHFKGYLIRRSYKLGTIPLWLKAQQMVATESGCVSELANNVVLGGYSEGGYGAVATAEAMECIGVDVLSMLAGAGPYQIATAIPEIFVDTKKQLYPRDALHYLVLYGSSASTVHGLYQEKYNYSKFLATEWSIDNGVTSFTSNDIINLTTAATSARDMRNFIPQYPDDPTVVLDSRYREAMIGYLDANITDPCRDPRENPEGYLQEICNFFLENDLRDYLHNVTYYFELCHSPTDAEVPISNVLPEFDYAYYEASGSHQDAFVDCFLRYMTLSSDDSVANAPLKNSGLCSTDTPMPSMTPNTAGPTPLSSKDTDMPSVTESGSPSITPSNTIMAPNTGGPTPFPNKDTDMPSETESVGPSNIPSNTIMPTTEAPQSSGTSGTKHINSSLLWLSFISFFLFTR